MEKEMIILCNSAACLAEISSGKWPNLHERNIFTCNFAYTYFRTNARHLNMFSDATPIISFLGHPQWGQIYDTHEHKGIEFILNEWDLATKRIFPHRHESCKAQVSISPVKVMASSGYGALLHCANAEQFDVIYLVGYTLNEWEGIENVKELKIKQNAIQDLHDKYHATEIRPFVWEYRRKHEIAA